MAKRIVLNPKRDYALFGFLWRWKVSTTQAIAKKIFPNTGARGVYYRLRDLWRAGYIERVADISGQVFLWTLSKNGFEALKCRLPPLREHVYKSNYLLHDQLVQAVHLGEWLLDLPKNVELFTEQQIRGIEPEAYPSWMPVNSDRRPDGYWYFKNGYRDRVVALEVEISRKALRDYRDIADFYSEEQKIDEVLWLVPSIKTAMKLQEIFNEESLSRKGLHNFIVQSHFEKLGWNASIIIGKHKEKKLYQFLNHIHRVIPPTKPGKGRVNLPVLSFLDGRTIPLDSRR